ncbi:hypothetical protein Vafri_4079, partial [Volvox africanus]
MLRSQSPRPNYHEQPGRSSIALGLRIQQHVLAAGTIPTAARLLCAGNNLGLIFTNVCCKQVSKKLARQDLHFRHKIPTPPSLNLHIPEAFPSQPVNPLFARSSTHPSWLLTFAFHPLDVCSLGPSSPTSWRAIKAPFARPTPMPS